MKVSGERIKGDQEDRKEEHQRIPHATWLFLSIQHIANRQAKEKHLQACHETGCDFYKRKLMKKGNEKYSAADYPGRKAHQNRKNMPAHRSLLAAFARAFRYCFTGNASGRAVVSL
jgi:hypothetical protein